MNDSLLFWLIWLSWWAAAALLGRLNNSHVGARWFALSAGFCAVAWPLLVSVLVNYKVHDPPLWVTTLFGACIVAHGALAVISLQQSASPRKWNVWATTALLLLPLLWLLGNLGLGFYLTRW